MTLLWPPALVSLLRDRAFEHAALAAVPDTALDALFTNVFFASLESEELERHPIRVAFVGRRSLEAIPAAQDAVDASHYRWRALPFTRAARFDAQHLVKLARAAASERLYSMVALVGDELQIVGIAREGFQTGAEVVLKIIAPSPGCLEAWCGARRVLDYVRGAVRTLPENILLAAGPVRRALQSLARAEGVSDAYLSSVAGLVRAVAAHGYGGILAVSAERVPAIGREGFVTDADVPLCAFLERLEREEVYDTAPVVTEALHAEIDRTVAEVGRLTALDGAVILDRALGLRGFGVVLAVAPHVEVVEATDAEGTQRVGFALERRGARHHAAASYAFMHPGSVVFVASVDGGLACMLREPTTSQVLLWRVEPNAVATV